MISSLPVGVAVFAACVAVSCGAPGEPTPPASPIPAAIADLSAQQAGDAVELTFTMPAKTISGERISEAPAIEILRGQLGPDGSPDQKSFSTVDTIPGALAGNYRVADKVIIPSRLPADQLRTTTDVAAYRVRTRASRKRSSADSNTVIVHLHPVPERIAAVHANVTESAIELSWSVPTQTSAGDPLPAISEFRIYRGELDPASAAAATNDIQQAKWKSALAFLAASPASDYRDSTFDFDKTYLYTVRTVIPADGALAESSDSAPAIVTPRDIFPPAIPQGLQAAVIVGSPTNSAEVDLSWSLGTEADLAGYRLYRSEQVDAPGQLLTRDLLLSPAYRDMSVLPGHRYWYTVTAIDHSGNESEKSAPVAVEIAQPSS